MSYKYEYKTHMRFDVGQSTEFEYDEVWVTFSYTKGHPQTRWSPADPAEIEVLSVEVLVGDKKFELPEWMVEALADDSEFYSELCEYAQNDMREPV